jgi:hypothetical protein
MPDDGPFMLLGILGDVRVLAVFAMEIASYGPDGKGFGAGQVMKKRFLFDGIDMLGNDFPVHQGNQGALPVFPHPADSATIVADDTSVGTQPAADLVSFQFFVKNGFLHDGLRAEDERYIGEGFLAQSILAVFLFLCPVQVVN